MQLEVKTAFLFYVFVVLSSTLVLVNLWQSHKEKYKGLDWFVAAFSFQIIALTLMLFRDKIPDLFSIIISNLMSVWGMAMLYIGMAKFLSKKPKLLASIILIFSYTITLIYHTYISPNLNHRIISFSAFFVLFCAQIIILLVYQITKSEKALIKNIKILIITYAILNIVRIIGRLIENETPLGFFETGIFESVVIINYSILNILLCFSIVIAVNRRLIQEIQLQDQKFYKAFHHAPHAIIITEATSNKIIQINEGFTKATGYRQDEVIGKNLLDLNLWVDKEIRTSLIIELLNLGELRNKSVRFRRKDHIIFEGILHTTNIKIYEETYFISTIEDTTETRELIRKLQQTTKELGESNRAKDKLFSIIAHDLKSPFANVVALSEILKQQIADNQFENLDKHANAIEISSKRASELLQNLLEWSRLQTGNFAYNPKAIEPHTVINEVTELLQVNLERKSIKLSVQNEINYPLYLDANIMSTILRNLISNAIKFTPRGGQVWVIVATTEGGSKWEVKDTGIGIAEDKIPILFDASEKTSTLGTEQEKGTGLGLPICRELAKKHGGILTVKSIVNEGTSFILSIPNSHLV